MRRIARQRNNASPRHAGEVSGLRPEFAEELPGVMGAKPSNAPAAVYGRGLPRPYTSHPVLQFARWAMYEMVYELVYGSVADAVYGRAHGPVNNAVGAPACRHETSRYPVVHLPGATPAPREHPGGATGPSRYICSRCSVTNPRCLK
jgi:hypothetical protein